MTAGIVAQLRALRIEQGLPLKVVAHKVGVSLEWLCNLEHGTNRARSAEFVERWARSLGAEVVVVAVVASKARPRKSRAA
jgi:transcriptional regulator with XRE-family HTH domain